MSKQNLVNTVSRPQNAPTRVAMLDEFGVKIKQVYTGGKIELAKAMERRYIEGIIKIQKTLRELERDLRIEAPAGSISDPNCLQSTINKCCEKHNPNQRLDILGTQARLMMNEAGHHLPKRFDARHKHMYVPAMEFIRKIEDETSNMAIFFANCPL